MAIIHDEEFEDLLVASVTIDEHDLAREYYRVATDTAYWCRRLAQLEGDYLRSKTALRQAQAEGFLFASSELTVAGKKPTQAYLEAYVETMASVKRAHDVYAQVTQDRKEAQGYVDAVAAKRDMLIQVGATRRQEMKSHLD